MMMVAKHFKVQTVLLVKRLHQRAIQLGEMLKLHLQINLRMMMLMPIAIV